jgi:hypothetical protein
MLLLGFPNTGRVWAKPSPPQAIPTAPASKAAFTSVFHDEFPRTAVFSYEELTLALRGAAASSVLMMRPLLMARDVGFSGTACVSPAL